MTEAAPEAAKEPAYDLPQGFAKYFYWAVRTSLVFYGYLYHRYRVLGKEHLPKTGPVLVVSNHSSYLDPPMIASILSRRLSFLSKAELFEVPVLRQIITWLNAFPIKRGGGDREALRMSVGLLKAGHCLVMFPEGTRTQDGNLQEPRPGVAMMLAQVPECQILPIYIGGSFESFGHGKKFPRPVKLTLTVGKPFRADELPGLPENRKERYRELPKRIMEEIAKLKS